MAQYPRLLANVVDSKAKSTPNSPYLLYALSSKNVLYHTITWKQFANAINKAAFWLDKTIPRKSVGREPIAYSGPNDVRYYILLVAAAKSGRTLFIPDRFITADGLTNILAEIQCVAWVYGDEKPTNIATQPSYLFPAMEDILNGDDIPQYPYKETWEQSKDDTFCIIHTSGTTGLPKPIYIRNGYISVYDGLNTLFQTHHPRTISYQHLVKRLMLMTCAPQWVAGIGGSLFFACYLDMTTVMLPADMAAPFDPSYIMRICDSTGATGIIAPPYLVEDLYKDERTNAFLKGLKYVLYTGATLDEAVGNEVAKHTCLIPGIGSTELGMRASFEPDDVQMWNSFDFVPELGCRFTQIEDDLYELHIDRTSAHQFHQCGFFTFPHLDTLDSSELYSPVTSKSGSKRWVFRGRKDDLLKLSFLARFDATHLEADIAKYADVGAVIVGGEGRHVPYVIVEPKNHGDIHDREAFIDAIYKLVVEGYKRNVDEIRIPRETIMLSDPSLPFKRTTKMTLKRREVEKDYAQHIDQLYRRWGDAQRLKRKS